MIHLKTWASAGKIYSRVDISKKQIETIHANKGSSVSLSFAQFYRVDRKARDWSEVTENIFEITEVWSKALEFNLRELSIGTSKKKGVSLAIQAIKL